MILWTWQDRAMLALAADAMHDRLNAVDEYTDQDWATVVKMRQLADAVPAVTVSAPERASHKCDTWQYDHHEALRCVHCGAAAM